MAASVMIACAGSAAGAVEDENLRGRCKVLRERKSCAPLVPDAVQVVVAVVPKALPEQFAVHGEVGTVLCQPTG